MKQVKNWLLGGVLAVVLTAAASAADLQKGIDAFNAGDHATALTEFTSLAEAGDVDAQYNLGVMYHNGIGVPQDNAQAVKWWRLAAEAGLADAQYNLGVMYHNGIGVPQDNAQAVKWWRLAAEAGHADAQYNLGGIYFNDEGVTPDYAEAGKWFKRAAEQGHAEAQAALKTMYAYGFLQDEEKAAADAEAEAEFKKVLESFFLEDYATAHAGFTTLAEAGNIHAQHFLGSMYAEGTGGILQNYHLGYMWLALAAAQGHELAKTNRDKVARLMSPAQVAEAQAMAQKCLAQNYKGC